MNKIPASFRFQGLARLRTGGRRVGSAATFTDLSPIDEQPVAAVARGGEAEIAAAVRAAVLHAIADGIDRRAAGLARVETADNGALLRSHLRSVMPRAAQNFRFFADWLGRPRQARRWPRILTWPGSASPARSRRAARSRPRRARS